ncbi:CapA family protein [Natronosporangium hydrolyticum]|uniref:CapA family protein n=1 Tax=Natronosporangium hydrolyticum TaxID=2811111 RepID=A0A895YI06_9ACTN|nr:CapA family protein [Natronosporangium hydrolyticum]QSB15159.1 CapA family protein [Natronosporangium hydrolyticum]
MTARHGDLTLCLTGDVMTGRGVDQLLPHPGDPQLWEGYVTDARTYLALAETAHGPAPRPADPSWPWGEVLDRLAAAEPAVRIINLETSITSRGAPEPGKAVHYRMSPANIDVIRIARPDACILANNHTLDFGPVGLLDTLDALASVGLTPVGAGVDAATAAAPAAIPVAGGACRVIVAGYGSGTAGVPRHWAATAGRPGVNLLPDLSTTTAGAVADQLRAAARPGDITVASVHWGANWGYEVPAAQTAFAHRLIDGGVDLVHGHSSHHFRPIEFYRGRPILYGCGDLIDDYEGITGYERFRPDLRLLYFARFAVATGELRGLSMAPLRMRRLQLAPTTVAETTLLAATLDQLSRPYGSRVLVDGDGTLRVEPDHG